VLTSHASPNPFHEVTNISVDIPETIAPNENGIPTLTQTPVSIAVYDVLGRRVTELFDGSFFSQVQTFRWDGTDADGRQLPSGIYFLKVTAGAATEVKKVAIVR
jgi:hypothetical protein